MATKSVSSRFSPTGMVGKILLLARHLRERPLGRRVLAAILLSSTILAFLATGVQLLLDYRHEVSGIELRLAEIERSYLDSIGASLWDMNEQQARKQLEGITRLPDIVFAQIQDPQGKVLMETGSTTERQHEMMARQMPIYAGEPSVSQNKTLVGMLVVTVGLGRVYADLQNKALVILISQSTKTLIVAIFSLFIFVHLVSRHLSALASYARKMDLNNLTEPLVLSRTAPKQPDELDVVVAAINTMTQSIKNDVEELTRYRFGLEELVATRTEELAQKIAQLEIAERTARESEERYRQLVEMSPDAILIERDGKIIFANNGALKLLKADNADQMLNLSALDLVPLEWRKIVNENKQTLLSGVLEMQSLEERLVRFDGSVVDVEVSRAVFHDAGAQAIQTVAHDITKHKHFEDQLRSQALHDALTGLPNRILLMDRIAQAIVVAERQRSSVFVCFFDLDHFKYINDTLGHEAGDEVLKNISGRILACVRKCDTLARLGGDEFVLLLENVNDAKAIPKLVQKILKSVGAPMMVGNQEVVLTCSIGLSVYPDDSGDASTLLKYADTAMYGAKGQGRNCVQRYSVGMHAVANERLLMESLLRRAIERQELLLHYQPKLSLRNGRIIGAEALIRWNHPELGLVAPIRFIPMAEETGLIVGIGEWVIRTTCAQAKIWQDAGLPPVPISVNLSAKQLLHPHLVHEIESALQSSDLSAEYLELEITESASMTNPQLTVTLLTRLQAMGVSITIDDFGTGYSNLSYLQRFPAGRLKLDQSFVRDITRDNDDAELIRAIIALAHSLHLIVVAEGVEEYGQLAKLVSYGCDEMQGYYFSRPVPAEAFAEMLREGRTLELPPHA